MGKTPVSAVALKMRAAKAQKTKEAKKRAALQEMGLMGERKKIRKPRKPMTDEQRAAASERLVKARAARAPAENSVYANEVRNLPDDDTFSLKNVKEWLAHQKELLSSYRAYKDSKDSEERNKLHCAEVYVANLENYIRTGVYTDLFYGANGTQRVKYTTAKNGMAYYPNGKPKRTVGSTYPDIGLYTQEMENYDRNKNFK